MLLQDAVLATLAAVGLLALLRTLAAFLTERRPPCRDIAVLLPFCGDAEALEYTVHTLKRTLPCRITIVDKGLSPQARAAAELLCREDPAVRLSDG